MAITVKEIAELAGVSRGTVDRALKNRPGISVETKKKILDIAEKYEYTPNIIGKALVYSGKRIKVAVVLNSIGNPFFDDVKRGIFAAADEFVNYGIEISLFEFKGYDAEKQLEILNKLPKNIENIILTPICCEKVQKAIAKLVKSGIHVVTLSSELENVERTVYVGCDYLKSGKVAGRLVGLLSGGKANLFVVTGSSQHKGHRQRVQGIRSITENEYSDINFIGSAENQDDDEIAYSTVSRVLNEHPEVDFVYIIAGGVNGTLRAIHDSGRKISVCSFDDTESAKAALLNGSILATICQQPFEQGYQSVKAIFDTVVAKKKCREKNYSELSIKVDHSL